MKRIKDKQKLFYSCVRSKQKVKLVIPHLSREDSETTTNIQEIADVLGKFFESVFYKGQFFLTNLLETFKSLTEDVDQRDSVDVIFSRFTKSI